VPLALAGTTRRYERREARDDDDDDDDDDAPDDDGGRSYDECECSLGAMVPPWAEPLGEGVG
jgi:hypothetical protein